MNKKKSHDFTGALLRLFPYDLIRLIILRLPVTFTYAFRSIDRGYDT
jgi:hypothetical protein